MTSTLVCGWCSSGKHLPSDSTRGCVQYRDDASAAKRPCPCPHPDHSKETSPA